MNPEVIDKIRALYAQVDQAVAEAGPRCDASGRCCRFKEYGHVLFLSNLEADVLLAGAPPIHQEVTPDRCPYQVEGLCTARAPRPLGCRIYFCDPNYQETGNALTESSLQTLKQLAEEYDLPWQYAPLHVFLQKVGATCSQDPSSCKPTESAHLSRIPLPLIASTQGGSAE